MNRSNSSRIGGNSQLNSLNELRTNISLLTLSGTEDRMLRRSHMKEIEKNKFKIRSKKGYRVCLHL